MIHLGTAGAWIGEPCGQSWYSWVSNGIETAPPERVCLDKLTNGVGMPYIREMAERARNDAVDGRVWLLFNEPDGTWESNYASQPKLAARIYWEAYTALKAARNDVIIGGPNHYWAGTIDEQAHTYVPKNEWFRKFTLWLDAYNRQRAVQAKIEVLGLHDYAGRYHDGTQTEIDWRILEEHIAWIRNLAGARECYDADVDIWTTETGMLWAQPEAETQAFMAQLLTWLDKGLVKRCYWFVSYDSNWWQYAPNTCLYRPDRTLTAIGLQWKAAGE